MPCTDTLMLLGCFRGSCLSITAIEVIFLAINTDLSAIASHFDTMSALLTPFLAIIDPNHC